MNYIYIFTGLGVTSLFLGLFGKESWIKYITGLVLLISLGSAFITSETGSYFNLMLVADDLVNPFIKVLLFLCLCHYFLFLKTGVEFRIPLAEYIALFCFILVGALVVTLEFNLVMLFLGIEIISIGLYIIAAGNMQDENSREASLKYFLMGSFSTGIFLLGITFIYGVTGTFELSGIKTVSASLSEGSSPLLLLGTLLILTGLAFKASAVPFHFWTPDVYQGSPTQVTAFMATVVKASVLFAFIRLFNQSFLPTSATWQNSLWLIIAATVTLGNVTALYQTSFKRMLAYSSIAHAGYMLMGVLTPEDPSYKSILFYALSYSLASLTLFGVFYLLEKKGKIDSLESFRGLAKQNPELAVLSAIALSSMIGLPPAAGFFAKLNIFTQAFINGYTGLVAIALITSLIGAFYYLRVIGLMFKTSDSTEKIVVDVPFRIVVWVQVILLIVFGIFPSLIQ